MLMQAASTNVNLNFSSSAPFPNELLTFPRNCYSNSVPRAEIMKKQANMAVSTIFEKFEAADGNGSLDTEQIRAPVNLERAHE